MVTKIEITNMNDLYAVIMEQDYRDDLKRYRSKYLYRGLSNSNYKLVTSLSRICKSEQGKIENALLNNFYKYAAKETNSMAQSEWSRMVIVSYSDRAGSFFACSPCVSMATASLALNAMCHWPDTNSPKSRCKTCKGKNLNPH